MSYNNLAVKDETFNLVTVSCMEMFLKHNPQFKGLKISQDFLIKRIALAYLNKL